MKAWRVIWVIIIATACLIALVTCQSQTQSPTQPSATIDLTGYWEVYLTPEGETEEMGPVLLYILQKEDSTLDCSKGFIGSISGSTVTLEGWIEAEENDPPDLLLSGTISGDKIEGSVSGYFNDGTFRTVPSTPSFGHLHLEGTVHLDLDGTIKDITVSLDTDYGLGVGEMNSSWFDLHYEDNEYDVWLWVNFNETLGLSEYIIPDGWLSMSWLREDGEGFEDTWLEDAQRTLEITRYGESDNGEYGIAGYFEPSDPFDLTIDFDVTFAEFE